MFDELGKGTIPSTDSPIYQNCATMLGTSALDDLLKDFEDGKLEEGVERVKAQSNADVSITFAPPPFTFLAFLR